MQSIIERAQQLSQQIIDDRRNLHQLPEVGVYLPKTAAYVKRRLSEMGVFHRGCGIHSEADRQRALKAGFGDMPDSTGIVATIGRAGPCLLLRADMDALPIRETTGLPFAADSDNGHMCGHDAHAAMLLGAAQLLKEREDELPGSVKLMFQPGEELGYGARTMVEDGLLNGPKVHAALAIHIMSTVPVGEVHYSTGVASSSLDTFMIKIQGRGGHSSAPHQTVDATLIANQLYTAVNLLAARETDPASFVTLNAVIVKCNTASNVIADSIELHCGFRTLDVEARNHLLQRLPQIIDHCITAWRGTYEITQFATPSTVCDDAFSTTLEPWVAQVVGAENIKKVPPMGGTEDFGYVSEKVPSMFIQLGAGGPDAYPHHNPNLFLDESVLHKGAALYANCAFEWLQSQTGG
ncbi:M20 family metallopeptidase [Oscillospiraceae bacterium OttesenSCG-928-G22]|nr:M20 family metallopeptidase [Oscillospiraceae bacterium OttesenSCG-928-G22]